MASPHSTSANGTKQTSISTLSIEDAMEDADMVKKNLKEMILGNWGNSHNA